MARAHPKIGFATSLALLPAKFLAQVSVFRFTDGDVHKGVQATIDSERQAEAVRIRQQIEEGRTAARDARDLKDLFDLTDEENWSLTQQVAELKAETAELTARLNDVQANFTLIREQMALESEGEPAETEAAPELETVSDALATAERDLADRLLVLGSARRSLPPDRIFRGRTSPKKDYSP